MRLPASSPHLLAAVLAFALIGAVPVTARAQADAPDQLIHFAGPDGETIEGGVWLPAGSDDGSARPLVVISHGSGGWYGGHADTAEALAEAGFVVAALTHPGDNFRDQSRGLHLTGRAPQLSRLIDYMTGPWAGPVTVDPERVGAFGFSAGGLTVTSIIGGVSDAQMILAHCAAHPEVFACRLVAALGGLDLTDWQPETRDLRVKAAVIAAPALGLSFTDESLTSVILPVQLWQAADDQILPSPYNVEPVRDRLGRAPEYHRVDRAGHYDFLTPCGPDMQAVAPELCASAPGFDRAAFKVGFNREVVRFFRQALAQASAPRVARPIP
ncbi:dienelactone hydrolase [Brevundimonas sp.]|uniref:alpha/beta hydrolase family protein n=1 Tax=Brevundimonas sp. TaxID=1871086 RepID=UPI0024875230|nr:dienelactone hydrolase [Brevundimonas sp.]MDI1280805.1 dienelactone hydrolase [Brevundimonas sp.]